MLLMWPREKLERVGVDALTNDELLAIVFGTGYKGASVLDYAQHLLSAYDISGLSAVRQVKALRDQGVPPVKSAQIVACFELGRRLFAKLPEKEFHQPSAIYEHVKWMESLDREQSRVILFDARHRILHEETIAIGTINLHVIFPKDFYRVALLYNAVKMALVHNHPSGTSTPSEADLELTRLLYEGCVKLGLDLVDHIIIGEREYTSLKQSYPEVFNEKTCALYGSL